MLVAIRPLVACVLIGAVGLFVGCRLDDGAGFGRVIALSPVADGDPGATTIAHALVDHGGEARRSFRATSDRPLVFRERVPRGARLEVAVANPGPKTVQALIRLARAGADTSTLLDAPIAEANWQEIAIDLSRFAGEEITLSFAVGGQAGALDWGEPILLERAVETPPPNIVLVTLDTTRADVAADPVVAPHLAALARRGVTFRNAWSAATSTTPGHASILTGLPVEQHGAVSNRSALAASLETLAERLAERGYQTAASVTVDHLGPGAGFGQGFGRFRSAAPGDARDGGASVAVVTRWLDGWAGDSARPFFLWIHLFDPHTPYGPPKVFVDDELARRGVALPPRTVEPPTVPIFPGTLPTPLAWLDGITSHDHVDALYRAGVAYADHLTGRVLDRIEALDLADDTLVVVTADHGEALGEQGVYYQHAGLWPASLHVPLVVAGPDWPSGLESDAPISVLDVHDSILASADRRTAEAPLARAAEQPETDRRIWFAESGMRQLGFRDADVHFAQALAAGQYGVVVEPREDGDHVRAIQRYAPGMAWLFDLRADPGLETNLARDPGADAEWYRGLVRERARHPGTTPTRRPLSPEAEAELRALGYAED